MPYKILAPDDPALAALQQALESHPEWAVGLEIIPWADYRDALMTALTHPEAPYPAVCVPGHVWIPELAAAGYLAALDDYLAGADPGLWEAYASHDLLPSVNLESCFEGKRYQFPLFSDGHILFYQPEYVPLPAGQEVPVVSPLRIAELAAAAHQPPQRYGLALKAHPSEIFLDWLPFLWAMGGNLQDEQGQPAFASREGIAALEYYCGLRAYCPPDSHTYGNAEIADQIAAGRVALATTWGGQAAPLYAAPESAVSRHYATAVYTHPWNATWGVALAANASHNARQQMTNILLQVFSPELDRQVTRIAGSPVRSSSYDDGELARFPWLAAQQAMLSRAGNLPPDPRFGRWLGALYGAVYAAFVGDLAPGEALMKARQELAED